MKERFKVIPAVYLVLIKDNKVLLLKRQNTGFKDNEYGLPSGHVEGFEQDESLSQALIRESKEEIGITLDPKNLKLIHVMNRPRTDAERVDFFFTTNSWQGIINNVEPNKCAELDWYDLNDLPDNTIDYIRIALNNILQKSFYSEYGF